MLALLPAFGWTSIEKRIVEDETPAVSTICHAVQSHGILSEIEVQALTHLSAPHRDGHCTTVKRPSGFLTFPFPVVLCSQCVI